MKGGIFARVTIVPLNAPTTTPRTSITAIPLAAAPAPIDFITIAPTTLLRATIEVADRSIPPVIITKVCPIAIIRSGNIAVTIFCRLPAVAKPSANGASAAK
jgi:hypothetical protein